MEKMLTLILAVCIIIFFASLLYSGNHEEAPGIVTLDSLANEYEPVIFNHSAHALIAGECAKCHHQHGNSGTLPCKDCHSVSPSTFKNSVVNSFMACKVCHTTADPDNPRMQGLKTVYHSTCFKCHRGMGNVGIDPKGCIEMCHAKKGQ